jgi:hypothetical protein
VSTALEACTTPAEKIDLFRETIEAESDLDGETIFNLALDAFEAMNEVGRAGEIDALVARIRERHPAGYEMEAYFLEASRAEAAILLDAPYAADALARFAPHAARHGAYRDELVILLEYHGRMDLLAPFTDAAWPFVRDDDDLFDGAIEDVAYEARTFVLCRWHDAGKPIRADDPELVEALERYTVEDDDVAAFIRLTTPPTDPRWTPNDFSKAPKTVELWAPYAALFAAFEADLRGRGWTSLRAAMGVNELRRMVRFALDAEEDERPDAALLPKGDWIAKYASKRLGHRGLGAVYPAAAFFAALEPWGKFLAAHGLFDAADERARVEATLRGIDRKAIERLLRGHAPDRVVRADLERVLGALSDKSLD